MVVGGKTAAQINTYIQTVAPSMYQQFFKDNMIINTRTVQKELMTLSNFYKVPYKFNKDLFEAIAGRSLFSSDTSWTNAYTQREINRLKSIVTKSLYEGKTEEELKNILSQTLGYTGRQSQLIARTERNRCLNTANSMYYDNVDHEEYEKVWVTTIDDRTREMHLEMDGEVADPVTGLFETPWGEYLSEPGTGSNVEENINCRCRVELRKIK